MAKSSVLKKRRRELDADPKGTIRRNIRANIRLLRGNRTFQRVCDLCSTDSWTCYPATIEQIERGRFMPTTAVLYRIAVGLGVTLNDLVAEPYMVPPEME